MMSLIILKMLKIETIYISILILIHLQTKNVGKIRSVHYPRISISSSGFLSLSTMFLIETNESLKSASSEEEYEPVPRCGAYSRVRGQRLFQCLRTLMRYSFKCGAKSNNYSKQSRLVDIYSPLSYRKTSHFWQVLVPLWVKVSKWNKSDRRYMKENIW